MKSHRYTLLLSLLLLTTTNGYTSRRKKTSPTAKENTLVSPHAETASQEEEHRRLSEPAESTVDGGYDHLLIHGKDGGEGNSPKANMAPTIQQLKGTIVKDDMNRGPPLASEFVIFDSFV